MLAGNRAIFKVPNCEKNITSFRARSIPESTLLHVGTIQVSGRGRGGNTWINPKGVCASTAVVTMPLQSPVTNRNISVVFVQYLSMLAYCKAILSYAPGFSDIPVRIDLMEQHKATLGRHHLNLKP